MSLDPILNSSPAIYIHAFAAIAAFLLGVIQLAAPKGTLPHRTLGWIWVILMGVVAGGSLLIHEINLWNGWSPIHVLSIYTLISLVFGVIAARTHKVKRHRQTMIALFAFALIIAGVFTFMPGRIMNAVLFGTPAVVTASLGGTP